MDMNVSPDLEAFCCYGLVLLLGLAVAWSQVSRRLGKLPGQWIMVNTWLLFFAYTFVPVLLFWFLDRTNAVHDTSLFAAVLVGFGYQQILTGSLGSIRAPGDVSKFWQPFGIWADSISDRIRERIIVNSLNISSTKTTLSPRGGISGTPWSGAVRPPRFSLRPSSSPPRLEECGASALRKIMRAITFGACTKTTPRTTTVSVQEPNSSATSPQRL